MAGAVEAVVKIVSIKRVDDKRQICRFFAVTFEGKYSAIQHIYQRKSNCFLPKHEFPASFSTSFTENHSSNTGKFIGFLRRLFFLLWNGEMVKEEKGYAKEQYWLIIIIAFKGKDHDVFKYLCSEKNTKVVIVLHNFSNKFKLLDISINK